MKSPNLCFELLSCYSIRAAFAILVCCCVSQNARAVLDRLYQNQEKAGAAWTRPDFIQAQVVRGVQLQ